MPTIELNEDKVKVAHICQIWQNSYDMPDDFVDCKFVYCDCKCTEECCYKPEEYPEE